MDFLKLIWPSLKGGRAEQTLFINASQGLKVSQLESMAIILILDIHIILFPWHLETQTVVQFAFLIYVFMFWFYLGLS